MPYQGAGVLGVGAHASSREKGSQDLAKDQGCLLESPRHLSDKRCD